MDAMSDEQILSTHAAERQRCEVYSRVMGYHRPLAYWNPGKRQEYADRRLFREDRAAAWLGCAP